MGTTCESHRQAKAYRTLHDKLEHIGVLTSWDRGLREVGLVTASETHPLPVGGISGSLAPATSGGAARTKLPSRYFSDPSGVVIKHAEVIQSHQVFFQRIQCGRSCRLSLSSFVKLSS
jgi:hypothetical protein